LLVALACSFTPARRTPEGFVNCPGILLGNDAVHDTFRFKLLVAENWVAGMKIQTNRSLLRVRLTAYEFPDVLQVQINNSSNPSLPK